MSAIQLRLQALRRPRLLIRAAKFGVPEYRRAVVLRRLVGPGGDAPGLALVERLFGLEAEAEALRQAGDAGYSPARHVELMVALIVEAGIVEAGIVEAGLVARQGASPPQAPATPPAPAATTTLAVTATPAAPVATATPAVTAAPAAPVATATPAAIATPATAAIARTGTPATPAHHVPAPHVPAPRLPAPHVPVPRLSA